MSFWRRLFGGAAPGTADTDDPDMKVIVGLGNPGREYVRTRHNVGWWVLDHLADVWRFDPWRKDGLSMTAAGSLGSTRVRLVKPQTFMNLSGQALRPFTRRENFSLGEDLLIVVDEVAIPAGTWRLREKGSPGGHNGLKDIERAVGSPGYARLRVGVGPDAGRKIGDLSDYVLGEFGKTETAVVKELFPALTDLMEAWVRGGVKAAMDVQARSKGTRAE